MACYICGNNKTEQVKGKVRDIPELKILKCTECGLVYLENFNHIDKDYYKEGNMNDWSSLEEYAESCVENDLWRVSIYKDLFRNKMVLDFGSGLGGFVLKMLKYCRIFGVEVDPAWKNVNSTLDSWMYKDIEEVPDKHFDFITMFHVMEHLKDPRETIKRIIPKLKDNGKLIIEVPNADDALLTMYDCEAFQNFSYWSAHLYLFNNHNLSRLIEQSGLECSFVIQKQRYPLSNHLYWLAKGKPGGHKIWNFIKSLNYKDQLSKLGKCDTLIAYGSK